MGALVLGCNVFVCSSNESTYQLWLHWVVRWEGLAYVGTHVREGMYVFELCYYEANIAITH